MARLGGPDEIVVFDVERGPEFLEVLHDLVAERLRRHAALFGDGLDLLSVFVGAGEEVAVLAPGLVPAGEDVRGDGRIGVAYVRHVVDVVDGRGNVKVLF